MNKFKIMIFVGVLATAGTLFAQTKTDIEVTRADIQADRKAIVAVNLPLTDAQADAFWPVYREYRGEMDKIGDRTVKMISDYATNFDSLTDEQAASLVKEFFAIQNELLTVKNKYAPRFSKVLPSKSVMRFYQIENKLDTIIMMNLAAQIPLAK